MRILFADDNYDVCKLYQLAFSLKGFTTHIAHTGQEAVEQVQAESKPFDVIILSLEMPVMDGREAFAAIRELPQGKDVPIVIFTAYIVPGQEQLATEMGAAAFLTKPALPQDLVGIVRDVVQKRQQGATGEEFK